MTVLPSNAEPLFDPGLPDVDKPALGQFHADGGDTEQAAAKLAYPKSGRKRARCLDAFIRAGDRGLTDRELAEATGLYLYTAAPRRGELKTMGWVEDSEQRREGMGSSTAIVWTLTPAAKLRLSRDVG